MKNKISVFGGTGFIGGNFCNRYPDDVIKIPRNTLEPESDDILYLISTTTNYNHPQLDVDTNLTHLIKVLDNCKPNNTFNFVSSWFIYGDVPLPAKEEYIGNPKGYYSVTKLAAERIVETYCKLHNIKYRILRLCNVYGSNDGGVSKKKNALQYLIDEIKNNRDINLYYNGNFIRDYMHVSDICRAIKMCMDKSEPNQIINIGSGIAQNFKECIDFAIKETNSSSKINPIDAVEFHKIVQVKDMYLDTTKLKSLGFKPSIDIFTGIRKLL
jgi:nucleoside-diphosphate-sugar epimerase